MRSVIRFLALVLCAPHAAAAQQGGRIKVERAVELPRHSYPVSTSVAAMFQNDQQFAALAQRVAADLRGDLSKYDIRDHATLANYYTTLSNLALERADYKTALAYQDSIRAVEDKPGLRLSAGMLERARGAAARGPGEPFDTARFRAAFRAELATLPYPGGDVALLAMKHRFAVQRPLVQVQRIEPGRAGSLNLAQAQRVIAMRVVRDWALPVRDVLLGEIDSAMASHNFANMWPRREVSLEGRTDLTPVTMGIWDSGVDVNVYPGQFFTNSAEIADNGKDDDGNGYIDDVHGIAYDIDKGRITGLMLSDSMKGTMGYGHGTSVTGLAVRGNPAARVLFARGSQRMGGHGVRALVPPTLQRARNFAQENRETIEYFRQHGVRVVNMSWGFNPNGFEATLATYNIGTPEEQRTLARQISDIAAPALHDAMAAAPDILFIAAAGNDDADVNFSEEVPGSFDLPNLIVVGAADAAGGETFFSNHGRVDVFAEGFEVPTRAPGGSAVKFTGTSAAAPQVVNLAAKLLAVKPTLTVAELRRAILESADEKTTGPGNKIKLLNPKAAMERVTR